MTHLWHPVLLCPVFFLHHSCFDFQPYAHFLSIAMGVFHRATQMPALILYFMRKVRRLTMDTILVELIYGLKLLKCCMSIFVADSVANAKMVLYL